MLSTLQPHIIRALNKMIKKILKKWPVFLTLKMRIFFINGCNVDIMTDDSLPYIGEIKDNLYIATGFNTWGMTNSFLSAKIISDRILK